MGREAIEAREAISKQEATTTTTGAALASASMSTMDDDLTMPNYLEDDTCTTQTSLGTNEMISDVGVALGDRLVPLFDLWWALLRNQGDDAFSEEDAYKVKTKSRRQYRTFCPWPAQF